MYDATNSTPWLRQASGAPILGVLIAGTYLNGNHETFTEFFEAMKKWFHALVHLECAVITTTPYVCPDDDVEMADI